ncbi:MAG TPA: TetR/AcrR family transcriptional regulator [Prolixibacteraceae bacterium]|jgi:AcrR family transcriptional regulator|nr:TetR/AcrR family transcriptional regulator [Prolixibacteraceae bacterium]HPR85049.1 TetR/AcrR family transcriptional regulator [Prolixibacteraceae bacterium]
MKQDRDTEKDIIRAAQKIFQEKGFKETTMRDVAAEANVNMAMLHYYFRSKENLFFLVLDEAFRLLVEKIVTILTNDSLDIFEKIRAIVKEYITFFSEKPYLPQFIMGEMIRNPEWIRKRMVQNMSFLIVFRTFSEQVEKEYEKGTIQHISALSLLLNIMSLCVFPAIVKPIVQDNSDAAKTSVFDLVIENRKTEVADFIIKAIKT